jgi:O-antigen/teichoic acid export membrane protein
VSDPDKNLSDETNVVFEALEADHMPPAGKRISAAGAVAQSVWAKLFIVGINASTGILTARNLMPAGRGELAAMTLWPVFLGSALTLGMPSALTYQMRSQPERQARLVGAALLIAVLCSIAAMALGGVLVPFLIHQYSVQTIYFARIFLFSCPFASIVLVGRAALECDGNFTASNKLLVVSPASTLLLLIVLALTHTMTPVRAAFAYVLVGIFPVIWLLMLLGKRFKPTLQSLRASMALLFSYGIRSYGIDLCGAMALYVDQALVVRVLTPSMMGLYVVALSLSRMLNAFHTSVVMVLFPLAVSQSPETIRDMTGRATRMSTLLTTLGGLCVMLLGPVLLTLLYGREYRGALVVLDVLVVEVILSGATLVLSQAFMALGRPGVITILQVTGLMLSVPLILVLTPRLGILGAGLGLLISTTARLLFVLICFPAFVKLRVPDILPRVSDLLFLKGILLKRLCRQRAS